MTYVDWDFYVGEYLGEIVEEEAFARLAERASRALDMLTFGRIDRTYAECGAVKMACCAVCDVLAGAGERDIVREKLDAYEVQFDAARAGVSLKRQALDAARAYLWRTGLLAMAVGV